jgi:pimeloyl-ACP methyl ester carboxylesterase
MTESQPYRRVSFDLPGGRMAAIAFGDQERPVDVLFLHATGFNALTYHSILGPLGDRLHVVAVDLRGHGKTTLPAKVFGYAGWDRHRDDVIALIDKGLGAPVTLAGHSMGGCVSALAAGKRPDMVRGLALLDPVILPPRYYAMMRAPGAPLLSQQTFAIARKAAKRRDEFVSRAEMATLLTGRGIFKSFTPEMLADYCEDGAVDDPFGGVKLACRPTFEARTFAAQRHDPWAAFTRYGGPVVVLRAQHGSTMPNAAAERLKRLRPDAMIATVDGASHALPMERPDRARAAIEAACVRASKGVVYRDLV